MRFLGITAKLFFILFLPFFLLTSSLAITVNSAWLYNNGFEKYNVSQTTGLAPDQLNKAATELIKYFNDNEEYISVTVIKDNKPFDLFNQREIIHLKDVKGLIQLDYRVLLATLIYIIGFAIVSLFWRRKRYWRDLALVLVSGSGLTLFPMIAFGLGALFAFDQLFWQFHLISFTNELWLLDPTQDYLIRLFTQGFFYDVTLFFASLTVLAAIILGTVCFIYLKRHKPQSLNSISP